MVSSDSPDSLDWAVIFSSFCSILILTAPERSSANWATRPMAAESSEQRTTTKRVLSRGMTAS